MRLAILIALLAPLLTFPLGTSSYAQNSPLAEYSAQYQASANGLAAEATRSLRRTAENSYRLSNTLEANVLGQSLAKLEQNSEFELRDGRIQPQAYSYQLSGVSRASHAISYNWEAQRALSSEDDESWQLTLHEGVLDQLSYQAALRQAVRSNNGEQATLTFELIDGDEIDSHEYRINGSERLDTPLGTLNTLKLERLRAQTDERVTEFWLAEDWDFLLVRLEQVNSSGLRILLELSEAEIAGAQVRALD